MNIRYLIGCLALVGCSSNSVQRSPAQTVTQQNCTDQGLSLNADATTCRTPTSQECLTRSQILRDDRCETPEEKRVVHKMAILGDSIATGVLSNTKVGTPPVVTLDNALVLHLDFGDGMSIGFSLFDLSAATLGSQIQILAEKYKQRSSAFYGGTDLTGDTWSHASKLNLVKADVTHLARAGNRAADVREDALANQSTLNEADYIVVEVGANDFCSSEDNETIKAGLKLAFEQLLDQLTKLQSQPIVLILPIPNIPAALQGIKTRTAMKYLDSTVQCQQIQEVYCPRIKGPLADQQSFLGELNQIIADAVKQAGSRQIFLNDTIRTAEFSADDFSTDCFHPSQAGHKKISDLSFPSVESIFSR